MKKLFRNIQSIIMILEIVGTLLSAIFLIFNNIGLMKNVNKYQPTTSNPEEKK
jgi:hypothetical protein